MIRIYTLSDPRTNQVFYVGASKGTVKEIASRHVCNGAWFGIRKELRRNGLKPIVEFIESSDDTMEIGRLETYWIWQFKAWGFKLDNIRMFSGYEGSSMAFMSKNWMRIMKERSKGSRA
jgi:hypothetical protein